MTHLRIRSARPGLWRAGIQHPAVQILPAGDLTPEQRALIEAEPLLTVEEIPEGEVVLAPATAPTTAPAPALPVEDVLRLLLVEPSAELLTEISAAVAAAVTSGLTHDQFRPQADAIFARHDAQQGVQDGDLGAGERVSDGNATGMSHDVVRQIADIIYGRQEGSPSASEDGSAPHSDPVAPAADQAPEADASTASGADTKKRRTSKAR